MESLEQKVKKYKSGTIKQFDLFLRTGKMTASEIEFIANGAVVASLNDLRRL